MALAEKPRATMVLQSRDQIDAAMSAVMRDRRWRTVSDIIRAMPMREGDIAAALYRARKSGLAESETAKGLATWRWLHG